MGEFILRLNWTPRKSYLIIAIKMFFTPTDRVFRWEFETSDRPADRHHGCLDMQLLHPIENITKTPRLGLLITMLFFRHKWPAEVDL